MKWIMGILLSQQKLDNIKCGQLNILNLKAKNIYNFRWSWNNGIWTWSCNWSSNGKSKTVVFNIAGDGSFGMNCNEFATAVKNKIPIIVIVMNNNALGMVRQWQSLFYEERYSETTLDRPTDFVKLAEAFGANGI